MAESGPSKSYFLVRSLLPESLDQIFLNTRPEDQHIWLYDIYICHIQTYRHRYIQNPTCTYLNVFFFPSQFLFRKDLLTSTNAWSSCSVSCDLSLVSSETCKDLMPRNAWKNSLYSYDCTNSNGLHLHLWVSFSKLSILLLHLLSSQDEIRSVKGQWCTKSLSEVKKSLIQQSEWLTIYRSPAFSPWYSGHLLDPMAMVVAARPEVDQWPTADPQAFLLSHFWWRFRCGESNIDTQNKNTKNLNSQTSIHLTNSHFSTQ